MNPRIDALLDLQVIDKQRLASDPVELVLPVSPDKSGVAYTITAGFQLTPEELARNRTHGVR